MTVLVRPKRVKSSQRHREIAARHASGQSAPAAPDAGYGAGEQRALTAPRLSNDHAVYTCTCGYVFEAPVSTSVGCPHCGGTQAW
jgi:hypothetical protein